MRDLSLYRAMLGLPSSVNVLKHLEGPKADSQSCYFIESGYLMEILEINSKEIISLFFGPGEFVIQCHPDSNLVFLDDTHGSQFSHEAVMKTLRKFPESIQAYRRIRKEYYEKVADRLRMQELPIEKRLEHLKKSQSWVFELAEEKNIASYLGISLSLLKKMTR